MKQKRIIYGTLAILLALMIIAGLLPVLAIAEGELGTIESFTVNQTDIKVAQGTPIKSIGLPTTLAATMEGGESKDIAVKWEDHGSYDKDTAGKYTFTAVIPTTYTYTGARPTAVVTVGTSGPLRGPINGNSGLSVSLIWMPDECDGTVTGNLLLNNTGGTTLPDPWGPIEANDPYSTPWSNYFYTNRAKLRLQAEGNYANAVPGSVQIRIPRKLFTTKEGEDINLNTSLPLAPSTGGTTSFNYSIDEGTDEFVITNYEMLNGPVNLLVELDATYAPHHIASGATKNIQASMTDGEETLTSNTLTATMDSYAEIKVLEKSWNPVTSSRYVFTYWQNEWGTKPADADNYIYFEWDIDASIYGAEDFTAKIQDNPSIGEVVAWKNEFRTNQEPWILQSTENLSNHVFESRKPTSAPSSTDVSKIAVKVMVRVPKPNGGETLTINNSVTVTVTGADINDISSMTDSSERTYTYHAYLGDVYDNEKYYSKDAASSYIGGMDKLLAGLPVKLGDWAFLNKGTYFSATQDSDGNYDVHEYTASIGEGSAGMGFGKMSSEYNHKVSDYNLLVPGVDYEFDKLYLDAEPKINDATIDPGGQYVASITRSTDDVYEFFVTTKDAPETKLGEVRYLTIAADGVAEDGWHFVNTATSARTKLVSTDSNRYANTITLPDKTINVRASIETNAYSLQYMYYLSSIIYPTDHVKGLITAFLAENYNIPKQILVINFGAWGIKDHNGEEVHAQYTEGDGTVRIKLPIDNEFIIEEPTRPWGKALGRLTRYTFTESNILSATKLSSDIDHEYVKVSVRNYNEVEVNEVMTDQELEDIGLKNHSEGTFYQLLPPGTSIDKDSVQVFNAHEETSATFKHTVSIQENFANTGRTMVVIRVWDTDGSNYCTIETGGLVQRFYKCRSGWQITYTYVNPLSNLTDNGRSLRTHSVYTSPGRIPFINNWEDSYTGSDQGWNREMAGMDVDGDGVGDTESRNFHFASVEYVSETLLNVQSVAAKGVSSPLSNGYEAEAQSYANGEYSYRIRFENLPNMKAKNIILYDVLEEAYGTAPHWKGTFAGVNYVNATNNGIDVTVYYSTLLGLDPKNNATQANVANTAIWSSTPPADLSTVTAVAFDCSTATEGGEFILPPEETFYVMITMVAPGYTTEDAGNRAYNMGFMASKNAAVSTDEWADFNQDTNVVSVTLGESAAGIEKTANPASGTSTEPTEVVPGDVLTYKLTISNSQVGGNWTTAEVIDNLPAPLTASNVDVANVKYCYMSNQSTKHSITATGNLALETSGSQLKFTVKNLQAGESMIIEIPVNIPNLRGTLVNKASITKINNTVANIESGSTYHEITSPNIVAKLTKNVVDAPVGDTTSFNFTVTIKDAGGTSRTGLSYTGQGGKANGTIPATGLVTLSDGQSILISGVEAGDKVSVSEASVSNYSATYTIDNGEAQEASAFTDSIVGENGMDIVYTNTYNAATNFSVTKAVAGDLADLTESFDFTITVMQNDGATPITASQLTYEGIGGKANGTISLNNGVGEFSLTNGQGVKITDMPSDAKVTVVEDALSGEWTTSHKIDGVDHAGGSSTGVIDASNEGSNKTVAYTNTFARTVTGILFGKNNTIPLLVLGVLAIGIAGIFMTLHNKRMQRKPKH